MENRKNSLLAFSPPPLVPSSPTPAPLPLPSPSPTPPPPPSHLPPSPPPVLPLHLSLPSSYSWAMDHIAALSPSHLT